MPIAPAPLFVQTLYLVGASLFQQPVGAVGAGPPPVPGTALGSSVAANLTEGIAAAAAAPAINSGDTAWMLVATALVLMMTIPGLALFYGGLVRSKNVLSTFMHSLFCAAIVSVLWVLGGYSIAFGPTVGGWFGSLDFAMLRGVYSTVAAPAAPNSLAPTIPHSLFAAYQLTFAIITPALISGAFAERMRFVPFALLMVFWSLLVYSPLAHWVWGGGWIGTKVGALDFAGGTVVHISSGVSALVCALYLGKRRGYGSESITPHNLPFTVMGAGLLWVGWFGFNAGSALKAGETASLALINTNSAAAAAALGWLACEFIRNRHATLLGAASGAVAGLVVITPAAGFVTPGAALLMGLVGGAICYAAVSLKPRLGYDDALDVVGVHFVGGTLGALLTGVFATGAVNADIATLTGGDGGKAIFGSLPGGLVDGHPDLILKQLIAVGVTIVYCGLATLAILIALNAVFKFRASSDEEIIGMDLSQHRERAYALGGGEAMSAAAAVLAEPRAANAPPVLGRRFAVTLDGASQSAIADRWRRLCQENQGANDGTEAFKTVYSGLATVRNNTFKFHGGEPEAAREALGKLFADTGATATLKR